MRHLALRAGHVGAVAAVDAVHGDGALPDGGAYAIHRGVAAADHDHALAARVERAGLELRHGIAEALAVAGGEVGESGHDVVETAARSRHLARLVDADRQQHGVVLALQLGQRHVAAELAIQLELDAALGQLLGPAQHDRLFQLEVRDAIDHQSADAVVAVINRHLVALAAQELGGGEARRPGADNADRFSALARRLDRLHPAHLERGVGDVTLDLADGDGAVAGLLDHAIAFAQPVLRADAAADLREGVGGGGDLVGLLQPALGGQLQPVGDVVVERAMDLAERHAALRAAAGLGRRRSRAEPLIDLLEVLTPQPGLALVRHGLGEIDEFQQMFGHPAPVPVPD